MPNVNTCPESYYEYEIHNEKQCYSECPPGKFFIDFNIYTDYNAEYAKTCLESCTDVYYFHELNSYSCIKPENCRFKFADFPSRTCVQRCDRNYISEIFDSNSPPQLKATICLNECNSNYGLYLTPENKCVSDCTSYSPYSEPINLKCICKNLYYYDNENTMRCIDQSVENCQSNSGDLINYKINKAESKECLENCNGVLSVNEDICYEDTFDCTELENTKLITLNNGQKKCECKYKHFFENGIKKCIGEDADCPSGLLYIPETNGCVDGCSSPYNKKFSNFCLRVCPDRMNDNTVTNECTCNNYWYISNQNIICLGADICPDSHPLLNPSTKQCLKQCRGTSTDILFIDKCFSSCADSNTYKKEIPEFLSEYQYADFYCLCKNVWYYDISEKIIHCSDDDTITCSDFYTESKFIVKDTKECVISCPEEYPYIFNSKCLRTCEMEPNEYYIKKVDNSKKCECINLWEYDNENNFICLRTEYCPNDQSDPDGYVQIVDTKQCLKGNECPPSYPLLFNKKCYKNCPENSYYNPSIEGTCSCKNLWYKYHDEYLNLDFIFCLPENIDRCPMYSTTYKYQISSTKECVQEIEDCPEESYVFNYICYENSCPVNTTENEDRTNNGIHYCECDKALGYWNKYNFDETNREYLNCGLGKCEGEYFNLYIKENECIKSCKEKNGEESHQPMVSFKGICYEECPDSTRPKEDFIFECEFYNLNEAENLEDLRNYANIQVRELYQISNKGGYLFNNIDLGTTVQIYGIDKDNNINDKNLIMKSNLAYIDLGTCTQKIFEDNHLSEDDKILVIKYDMSSINIKNNDETNSNNGNTANEGAKEPENEKNENRNSNYLDITDYFLINPVEYEFFSSVTGEKIDASVCEPNEIIISYPISYTKTKYYEENSGISFNEYDNKFNIGKELHNKNDKIDTFNFNNSVYKDVCINVEINGKDLVLEDRYENLYPNNITLCESNCTYYYTDYELGRINCKCNYKEELDFYRQHPQASDILNDPNFNHPTQSGANGEVIKCLGKLPGKESITKNEAFYYSVVITAAEVSMVLVAAFHGIKAVSANITSLMNKANLQMNLGNKQMKKIKFKNDNVISTSNRVLNNPPKKGNNILATDDEEESEKSDKIGNIISKKNIEINNYKNNNIINDYENGSNINNEENENNYGVEIKNFRITSNIQKSNNPLLDTQNINNKFIGKTEFIPIEYNFKFFKSNDKGIIKKIEKSKLPFNVKPSTKYLLEKKNNINYDSDYLNGPFLQNQNIIEIIDDNKYNKNEKIQENMNNNINNRNDNQSIKTKTRNLKNNNNNDIINREKDFITIKKINPYKQKNEINYIVQDYVEPPKEEKTIYDNTGIYTLIKKEQSLLRAPFKKYSEKTHNNIFSIILAEIMDKIYLLKICCFLKKYEMFSINLALYLICHLILLTLLCAFFTIKTIKKIWNESNFPQLNFYLLYGFLGNIIIWIIYKIFLCFLDIQDKVKELIRLKSEANKNNENKINGDNNEISENYEEINEEFIQKKYNDVIKKIKIKTIIFFIIGFLLTIFCFIYLVSFFAIYTGTKSKVFKMYYISLIEIVLIKIVYGICLGALRIASEGNRIETIYKIVYLCDKYLS